MNSKSATKKISVEQLTRIALMGALIYASQVALAGLPNIELVTLLIVIFTKHLGKEGTLACFVYVMLTSIIWGFNIWWFTYLVVFPLFSLFVYKIRKIDNWIIWAIINGSFGLCFGAIFAIPYIFVSPMYAFNWWLNGIPYDITHCIGNFSIALVLGKPLDKSMSRIVKYIKK
ncbi:MAG: hypothetical protein K2N27_02970 [Ruminococcus sp.]|nr:hypothetical protein [Ruminococcus sp.]